MEQFISAIVIPVGAFLLELIPLWIAVSALEWMASTPVKSKKLNKFADTVRKHKTD